MVGESAPEVRPVPDLYCHYARWLRYGISDSRGCVIRSESCSIILKHPFSYSFNESFFSFRFRRYLWIRYSLPNTTRWWKSRGILTLASVHPTARSVGSEIPYILSVPVSVGAGKTFTDLSYTRYNGSLSGCSEAYLLLSCVKFVMVVGRALIHSVSVGFHFSETP